MIEPFSHFLATGQKLAEAGLEDGTRVTEYGFSPALRLY